MVSKDHTVFMCVAGEKFPPLKQRADNKTWWMNYKLCSLRMPCFTKIPKFEGNTSNTEREEFRKALSRKSELL